MKKLLVLFAVEMCLSFTQAQSWDLTGNMSGQQSFLGTLNMSPLRFKVNMYQRMIISPYNGFVGIGVNEPKNPLHVHADDRRGRYSEFNYEDPPKPELKPGEQENDLCNRGSSGGTNSPENSEIMDTTRDNSSYSAIQITNCKTGKEATDGLLLSMENQTGYLRQLEPANFNISMKGQDVITVTPDGRVGIGINPAFKFDVVGRANFSGNVSIGGQLQLGSTHLIYSYSSGDGVIDFGNAGQGNLFFRSLPVGGNINNFNHLMILTYDGRLGINTYDPGNYKLAVNGDVRAKSITVETGWSDFVFDTDYKLLSLFELERFIKQNKHLPEIPSEEEVRENGIDLGEMQSKLLLKIEELTIYTIEQQKLIEELQKRLSELEAKKGGE